MSATLSVCTVGVPLFFDCSVTVFVIYVSPSFSLVRNGSLFSVDDFWAVQKKTWGGSSQIRAPAAPSLIRVNSYLMVPETGSEVCLLLDTEYYRSTIRLN